ncbi:MAG: T9SS type A sorting domain-containing protein [Ferruginibacter sp.]
MQYKFIFAGIFLFSTFSIGDSFVQLEAALKISPMHFAKPALPFWEPGSKKDVTNDTASLKQSNWYTEALKGIEESEYEIKYDEATKSYASPNRKNNLRSFYTATTFTLQPRNDSADKWKLGLTLKGIYAGNQKIYSPTVNAVVTQSGKIIQFNHNNDFTVEYINNREGVRQNFIIEKEPAGKQQTINLKLQTDKGWFVNKVHDKEIHFAKATKSGYNKKITYNSLKVWDADNKELHASFAVKENVVSINVNTTDAVYPVTIDPLSTGTLGTPDWIGDDADQVGANFGYSVASAGDVNGDGYSDVIIGARLYDDAANADEGRAFVYYGSATGLSATPNSTPDDADQAGANFGISVASAGDVNGDGFSDVIIGAYQYDEGPFTDEGRAFVYYGSAAGLSTSPDNTPDDANQPTAYFGFSVASAGDVNGDGFSDVIIGAWFYDDAPNINEGRAFVYYGSAAGLSASPDSTPDDADQANALFGVSVASAGDINGDGYSDVIIGAYSYDDGANANEGRAFIYHGSASGLSATPNSTPNDANQANASFGTSVASAGDINGDGYSDVIIGADEYDDGANADEGRAFVYLGSAAGLSVGPVNTPSDADQAGANFGRSVASAGDINGDGYSDVIIGANFYTDGANNAEGRAFVYLGSAAGLSVAPVSTPDDADQASAQFGLSVACAGDVNGDGYSDVIIGAFSYDEVASANEGRAFVYHGSPEGLSASTVNTPDDADQATAYFGYSVASAGDVNSDGYSDVIIGAPQYDDGFSDEGRAFVYHGSATGLSATPNAILDDANQALAFFGNSVACAGDVNGDGYSDVIVGAWQFDDAGNINEGRAYVYHGSATGLNTIPASILDDADQAGAYFGISVAGACDVNGDGYSDVIIGAYQYDDDFVNEGVAFVYHGSASGLNATPNSTLKDANQLNAQFGYSVAGAGDVNGDGYSDVIIGANLYDDTFTNEGVAFVYHGSSTGLSITPNSILDDADQLNAGFGISVAGAGDVNGDGYSDVIIGANSYDDTFTNEGVAFVYHGSAAGLNSVPNSLLDDANQLNASFGFSVASAGDVNGDGYSDVIIGAPVYDDGFTDEGIAFVYHGSAAGLSATPNNTPDDANQPTALFGYSVACAGDVNGDGYSDVIIGAYFYDDGFADEGRAFVYCGNNAGGLRNNLFLYNQDLVTPIGHLNVTEPNLFGAGLFAKSSLGRVKGKLVWEVKGQGSAFSGNPITNSTGYLDKQPSFTNLGIAGVELKYNVQKVGSKNNKIRVRVEYDKATAITGQVYGPWRYPAGYTQGAHGMNSIPLPITLISFNGQFINADDVQLKWITTNEINMQTYVVERSIDGLNFTAVGELAAKGIGSDREDYLLTDKNVQHNLLYYRLKLKEKSGEISYTKVITLSRSKIVKGFIAPNPVQQGSDAMLALQSATDKNNIHINIFNSSGQLVFAENKMLQKGKNEIALSTNKLAKGIYVIHVLGDGMKESYRLVVQ